MEGISRLPIRCMYSLPPGPRGVVEVGTPCELAPRGAKIPAIAEVTLVESKGKPTVEIIFGQAHLDNYRFFLVGCEGKKFDVALAWQQH